MAGSEQAVLSPDGRGLNKMIGVLNYRYSHMYRINEFSTGTSPPPVSTPIFLTGIFLLGKALINQGFNNPLLK